MTGDTEAEPSSPSLPASADRSPAESPAFSALRGRLAAALHAAAPGIAERWERQSRTVALREPADGDQAVRGAVAAIVDGLAAALGSDGITSDDVVTCGLAFGKAAFTHGGSLHHALKGLDLMSAMVLYAVETAIGEGPTASAADGVRVSRRIQQSASLLTLAATKGYTQAMDDAMRDRFRHLRHDLRNPLGTIKSVLAMMDDETMPADARGHPRFRAMAKRNAISLGELIADRLGDTDAVPSALVNQNASLRTIVCGVRRDLRNDAGVRGVSIEVGDAPPRMRVDAIGLELILHELLTATLHEASAGEEIRVDCSDERDGQATVRVTCTPPRRPVAADAVLDRLIALAAQMRGRLERLDTAREQALVLSIPVRRVDIVTRDSASTMPGVAAVSDVEAARPSPAGDGRAGSGGGKARHDVRRSGEREDRQPGAL